LSNFFDTPINNFFTASLENNEITIERDGYHKENFNCDDAYRIAIILGLLTNSTKFIRNEADFLHFCSSSTIKYNATVKKDGQSKITLDVNFPNPK
jgi:hypothetical protein